MLIISPVWFAKAVMMKFKFFDLSVMALLASRSAQASVYFNSIDASAFAGYSANSLMAQSFAVNGTPNLTITLDLSPTNPADGFSILVYIYADDQSNGGGNTAGNPILATNSNGTVTGFGSPSVLVATISDSSLAATVSGLTTAVTFNAPGSALTTSNIGGSNEYWIGIATGTTGDAWWYNGDGLGVGTSGQAYYTNVSPTNLASLTSSVTGQAFQGIVSDAPEPTTLAIIGAGLTGLGYARRRRNTKA